MDDRGGNAVQITHGTQASVLPLEVGSLFHVNDPEPTGQILYVSVDPGRGTEPGSEPETSLHACDPDGGNGLRITYQPDGGAYDADVLSNGRVLFASWRHLGDPLWFSIRKGLLALPSDGEAREPLDAVSLLGVNIDGTDLMPYYDPREPFERARGRRPTGTIPEMIRVAPEGEEDHRVYFVESNMERAGWLGGGDLAYVSQRRPRHSYALLSHDAEGFFHSPCPLSDRRILASFRDGSPESVFAIYLVSAETGRRLEKVYEADGRHCVDTRLLVPRPRARGRSTVVEADRETGVLYCLSVYVGDRAASGIERGSVKRLRVIESVPPAPDRPAGASSTGPMGQARILGTATVEEDGSFHVEVPARTPIAFQLLDERGMAIHAQQSWVWVMPGESRACIGCHENPELAPPNRLVKAITRPAERLVSPPIDAGGIDFVHDVAPLLQNRCADGRCHVPVRIKPTLALVPTPPGAGTPTRENDPGSGLLSIYQNLLGPIPERPTERYVIPGLARKSPLVWHLFGKRFDENGRESGRVQPMPPDQPLSPEERGLMIGWIDLGAVWDVRDRPPQGPAHAAREPREEAEPK